MQEMVSQITRLLGRRPEPECPEIRMMVSNYLNGDLDAAQTEKIRTHREGCAPV